MYKWKPGEYLKGSPYVKVHRQGRLSVICFFTIDFEERLTREAHGLLGDFIEAYYDAHRLGKRAGARTGLTRGMIQVLPRHAEEFAARLLLFITDPSNFDPEFQAEMAKRRQWWDRLRARNREAAIAKHGPDYPPPYSLRKPNPNPLATTHEGRMKMLHQEVVAVYPDWADDPLGEIPGASEAVVADREEPCRG